MGFRDSLRQLSYKVRAIPGQLELRPYRVYVVVTSSDGAELGQGTQTETATEITEADSQPPRVRQLSAEEIAVGGYASGAVEIGPITPDFPGGGTPLSVLAPNPASPNATVRVRLVGPRWPNGALFGIREPRHDKTFAYKLIVEQIGN